MKALVCLSGGVDSALCLALAVRDYDSVSAIWFDYGQRHVVEGESARKLAAYYGVSLAEVHVPAFAASPLTDSLPLRNATAEDQRSPAYVPARNLVFAALATAHACRIGAGVVVFGSNSDDNRFPDCSREFFRGLDAAAVVAEGVRILAPLFRHTKTLIVQKARWMDVPLHLCWSCYDPSGVEPCQHCDACIALKRAGLTLVPTV